MDALVQALHVVPGRAVLTGLPVSRLSRTSGVASWPRGRTERRDRGSPGPGAGRTAFGTLRPPGWNPESPLAACA